MLFTKLQRTREITRGEVSKIIAKCRRLRLQAITIGIGGQYASIETARAMIGDIDLGRYFFVTQKDTKLEILTKKYEGVATTYIFSMDDKHIKKNSGLRCFMQMSKYYKIPKIIDEGWFKEQVDPTTGKFTLSTSPLIGYNKEGSGKEYHDCYEYDLNSAYSSVILAGIPDLWHPSEINFRGIKVKSNEIGFMLDEQLTLVEPGNKANITFPMIECPKGLQEFVMKYYNIKKHSSGQEKQDAKDMLNLPIGYTQRYNPFFRAYIIHRCNQKIARLIDENTLFWNTDAIFTTKRRTDLDIGESIGQFKEVPVQTLRYKGNTYQVNDDIPVYRGLPKLWFTNWEKEHGRKYNILTDETPLRANKYKFDMNTLKLEVR